ncbi:hypothetical protein RCL_jg23012.t2 [Rhizophagus clarus]|uniref:Uncharacterized protein n=1 Tax=Rhizophagus clarus TaxID=94130 RepID=A0A8H3L6X1_9GLOM|nr:hypothetical protein RCL_jg23012.t2 [Rhizophagus clarus]
MVEILFERYKCLTTLETIGNEKLRPRGRTTSRYAIGTAGQAWDQQVCDNQYVLRNIKEVLLRLLIKTGMDLYGHDFGEYICGELHNIQEKRLMRWKILDKEKTMKKEI